MEWTLLITLNHSISTYFIHVSLIDTQQVLTLMELLINIIEETLEILCILMDYLSWSQNLRKQTFSGF